MKTVYTALQSMLACLAIVSCGSGGDLGLYRSTEPYRVCIQGRLSADETLSQSLFMVEQAVETINGIVEAEFFTLSCNEPNLIIRIAKIGEKCGDWVDYGACCRGTLPNAVIFIKYDQLSYTQWVYNAVLHELGHAFGLQHVQNKECIMSDEVLRLLGDYDLELCGYTDLIWEVVYGKIEEV